MTAVGGSRVTTPSRWPLNCVNQMRPSGPVVIPLGDPLAVMPCVKRVMVPSGVMRPTRSSLNWVNQRLPSGPAVILDEGSSFGASENSVTVPAGVMRPMPAASVNQTFPSGPSAIEFGFAPGEMPAVKSGSRAPAGVIRPIAPDPLVNHRLPSGPATMSRGPPVVTNSWRPMSLSGQTSDHVGPHSAIQMLPSGPAAIPSGLPAVVPAGKQLNAARRRDLGDLHVR